MSSRFVSRLLAACALAAAHVASAASVVTNGTDVTVTTGSESFRQTFVAPDVSTVTYQLGGLMEYMPKADSTYAGGTTISGDAFNGQVMVAYRSNSFGTGPVTLVDRTGFYAYNSTSEQGNVLDLTNKLTTTQSSFLSSWDEMHALRLHSLGFAGGGYAFRLGRSGASYVGNVILSLDDPESEPLYGVDLVSPIALTLDGGLLKMAADARSPFVLADNQGSTAASSLVLGMNGCTFDVPTGVDSTLGLPMTVLTPSARIAVAETVCPANNDFENSLDGNWSVVTVGEYSGRMENGSPFDGYNECPTPDGKWYMMVRKGSTVSQTVELPNGGYWRVRFLCGCRPSTDWPPYSPQPVTVSLGGRSQTFSFEFGRTFGFSEMVSEAFELETGACNLAFSTGGDYSSGSMNIDRVVLERITMETPKTPIGKTGAGELVFFGRDLPGKGFANVELSVRNGVLALDGCDLNGSVASVADGATLTLAGCVLDESAVTVASGGRLILGDGGKSLVKNGSFEEGGHDWGYTSDVPKWTPTVLEVTSVNGGSWGGTQRNRGPITPDGPFTPFGEETVALRERVSLSQTVTVPADGTYRLSFCYAPRSYPNGFKQPIRAKIGDRVVVDLPGAEDFFDFKTVSATVELTAGTYDLSFESDSVPGSDMVSGDMLLIDNVQLCQQFTLADRLDGEFRLTSGSTLELDYEGKIQIDHLSVDGVAVNGGKAALRQLGVTVVGSGDVHCGEHLGMTIILR